jgi:hypothetical protein
MRPRRSQQWRFRGGQGSWNGPKREKGFDAQFRGGRLLPSASGAIGSHDAPSTITGDSAHGKTVKNRRRRATVRRKVFGARHWFGSESMRFGAAGKAALQP